MEKTTLRQATEKWLKEFDNIPSGVFETFAKADELVSWYDSDLFRLIASPRIECSICCELYKGKQTISQLREAPGQGKAEFCKYCAENHGHGWKIRWPEYGFPCGWGTLFSPKNWLDQDWLEKNAEAVTKLGFFVFESEHFDYLLGIDGGGFDFYEAFWIPLYKLRGLKWHTETSSD